MNDKPSHRGRPNSKCGCPAAPKGPQPPMPPQRPSGVTGPNKSQG